MYFEIPSRQNNGAYGYSNTIVNAIVIDNYMKQNKIHVLQNEYIWKPTATNKITVSLLRQRWYISTYSLSTPSLKASTLFDINCPVFSLENPHGGIMIMCHSTQ